MHVVRCLFIAVMSDVCVWVVIIFWCSLNCQGFLLSNKQWENYDELQIGRELKMVVLYYKVLSWVIGSV